MSDYRVLKQWQDQDFGDLRVHERAYFRRELSGVPLEQGARVLELGFGNGSFLSYAKRNGYVIHGVEADSGCIDLAREHGFAAFTLEEVPQLSGYDLIVAFDVFEHLNTEELHILFESFRHRLLKPGGHVIARFPNGQSPFGMVNQHGDITHKSVLGREKIVQLCYAHDLELIAVRNPSLWLHTNPLIAAARLVQRAVAKLIELGISLTYHSSIQPMQVNMIAHIKRPSI